MLLHLPESNFHPAESKLEALFRKVRLERWMVEENSEAVLQAVDVNLGLCNGQFLRLFDCLKQIPVRSEEGANSNEVSKHWASLRSSTSNRSNTVPSRRLRQLGLNIQNHLVSKPCTRDGVAEPTTSETLLDYVKHDKPARRA